MRIPKVQMLRDAQRLVEIVSVFVNEDSGVSHIIYITQQGIGM